MNAPISEHDLHAWADGRLDTERQAEVEAWLANHPEQRELGLRWREQGALLHATYDAVLDAPLPARFADLTPPAAAPRQLLRVAAAVAWLAIGGVIGFLARGVAVPPALTSASLPHQAAIAHAVYAGEVRHPVEVGADQEAHLVAWLSKRLGAPLQPPRLDAEGYRLIGGRLLAGDTGSVAQFMYEASPTQRLTLYVRNDAGHNRDTAFRQAREGNIEVFYWVDGRFGYALSGTVDARQMQQLATTVYRQLQPPLPKTGD